MLKNLLLKTRSYRRFYQNEKIKTDDLKEVVANTRLAASPSNLQGLRFIIVNNADMNSRIFKHVKWAGYLKEWDGPIEGERPSAYIAILGDRNLNPMLEWDYGIALQTMLLSLTEKGCGGCAIGSFNQGKIRELLKIPETLELSLLIAAGKPKEKVVIEDAINGNIKYYRDQEQVHHVPKIKLEELLLNLID